MTVTHYTKHETLQPWWWNNRHSKFFSLPTICLRAPLQHKPSVRAVKELLQKLVKLVDHKNELASKPTARTLKEPRDVNALTNFPRVAPLSPGSSLPSHLACPCSIDIVQTHDHSAVSLKLTELNSQLLQPLSEVMGVC